MDSIPDKSRFVQTLFARIAPRYDFANHLLSGGLDFLWRKHVGQQARAWKPRLILDLATGSGDIALTLRKYCPHALLIGADFCHPMLLEAKRKGMDLLVTADGMRLPFAAATFDLLTVAFGLRNMASWPVALHEMARVLRPDGRLLVLDFSVPSPPLQWLYRPYLHHILPRVAALVTGDKAAYDYLGESIEAFPHGQAMCALIEGAGFAGAKATPLSGGIVTQYAAKRCD